MASIMVLVLLLVALSDFFIGYIPFSWEQRLSSSFTPVEDSDHAQQTSEPLEIYLQGLADRIAKAQNLPEDMVIRVHYLDDKTVNAFATLGGNIFLFRGLLEKLPNENALAMLMAHEIAHIKYRHPIHSLGRGVVLGLVMSVVSSSIGDRIMRSFLNEAGYLTVLKYSRDMEIDADEEALQTLLSLYGHLEGADDLFRVLQQENGDREPFEFFSTHQLTKKRISNTRERANEFRQDGTAQTRSLPNEYPGWVEVKKSKAGESEINSE